MVARSLHPRDTDSGRRGARGVGMKSKRPKKRRRSTFIVHRKDCGLDNYDTNDNPAQPNSVMFSERFGTLEVPRCMSLQQFLEIACLYDDR